MNKIGEIGGTQQVHYEPKKSGSKPGDTSFGQMLDKALETGDASKTAAASAVVSAAPVAAPQELSALQREGVQAADQAVSLLEQYQQELADGGLSLKDLAGTVNALEAQATELGRIADQLEDGDRLKGLLGEVAAEVTVQSLKFNRGDLLPAA